MPALVPLYLLRVALNLYVRDAPMQRTVMLSEQPHNMSFSVCHTPYIHTETVLLNPKSRFFFEKHDKHSELFDGMCRHESTDYQYL